MLIKQTLQRYRHAYEGLDAQSARAVYPAVNEAALARAFDGLHSQSLAFDEVLSQYGLKREEAYRYSVSSAKALGPMQFTNRRGNGTYALVVRRCPGARLDPSFESGATGWG